MPHHACDGAAPQRRTKLERICIPLLVSTDSGWNCTPSMGRLRWRTPMMIPSAVDAVTSSTWGQVCGSMTSE